MMKTRPTVVVVDDDPLVLQALRSALVTQFEVQVFSDGDSANTYLSTRRVDAVILDLQLGPQNGLDLLKAWKEKYPETPIIICSGQTDVRIAMDCLKLGATDYLVKPARKEDTVFTLERAIERGYLKRRVEQLDPLIKPRPVEFIGNSPAIQALKKQIEALKNQPHLNVLILGESGTGKEILARSLHQQEDSANRPFVVANMPAIPANLMEAELFGVEKGAFTDAKAARAGRFELADGGDIFLDEVGDLPLELQPKILRTLQEKQIQRVGATKTQDVTFRAIAATNRPLGEWMSTGRFREDLIYRLSDIVLKIPPLRERKEDIPLLVEHFLKKHSPGVPPQVSEKALETLVTHSWPGNIRQLESTLKRALIFAKEGKIESVDIYDPTLLSNLVTVPASIPNLETSEDYDSQFAKFEKHILSAALKKAQGNKLLAMQALRLSRATFYRKLADLGLN